MPEVTIQTYALCCNVWSILTLSLFRHGVERIAKDYFDAFNTAEQKLKDRILCYVYLMITIHA